MKNWTLLFVFGFSFAACIQGNMEEIYFLRDDLVMPLINISWYITGKQKEVNDDGKIISEQPYEINFSKAHTLFADVARRLQGYSKSTKYPIAQSVLKEIDQILSELKQNIENVPDGLEKNQFKKEWSQLAQYVSSGMAKKEV